MKKILLFNLLFMTMLINIAWAQDRTVTGTVTSADDGAPLPGVNVIVPGTTTGTTTDIEGEYRISVPENVNSLVFSFIGYETQEVNIGNRSVVDVQLASDVRQLTEVVVTAFGIERERRSLNYATQELTSERINTTPQPNVTNALQGKVAGVIVRQSSGMPGASSLITIRGSGSLSGNNTPLYVVDGVPIESDPVFVDAATVSRVSGTDASNRALDINPEDIESINVLKGPAAAALYGLRASNGVVLITTKRGKGAELGAPTITLSTSYTMDQVTRLPKLQSTYAQGSRGAFVPGNSLSWGPRISELGTYVNNVGEEVQGQVYDNQSPLFQTGGTLTTNINVAGRSDNGNYSVGVGYTDQEGIIPTTAMQRINAKFAGDYRLGEKWTVGASVNYSDLSVDKIPSGSNLSNPLFTSYFAPRSYDLWGTPYAVEDDPYQQIHYRGAMDNPRWSLAHNDLSEQTRRTIGNINLSYNPLSWLSFNYRLGIDQFTTEAKEVYEKGSGETGGRTVPPSGGQITDFIFTQNQVNSNFNITLDRDFGEDFNINFLVGNELYDIRSRELNVRGTGMEIGGYHNMGNTASQIVIEEVLAQRVVGFYGSLTGSWRRMLFLTATGRNDFASNMPAGNRSFFYPSLGFSFVFSELLDLPDNLLSFGKIRASIAQVGQTAPNPYSTQTIFIQGGSGVGGFLNDGIQFPFSGRNAFTQSDILRSRDLRPINTSTFEVGAELRFLNDRLGVDYTYYNITATDQIFQVPLAPSTGFGREIRNAGELRTTGHEVVLTLSPVRTRAFNWDINVNYTSYENEVISLAPGVENIYLGGFTTPSVRAFAGENYPSIFGVGYLRDADGNIVLRNDPSSPSHGMPMADPEAKVIGNAQPDFEIGITNSLNYRGFNLTAQIDWRQGGQMYSGNSRLGRLYGILEITEDRETPVVLEGVKGNLDGDGNVVVDGENDIAIVRGEQYWNTVLGNIDEAHVHETTFVRLRELSLGYSFPVGILDNTFLNSANVSITGRNLFLSTRYPNFDPESSTTGAVNGQGIEYVALPQMKSYGISVRLSF